MARASLRPVRTGSSIVKYKVQQYHTLSDVLQISNSCKNFKDSKASTLQFGSNCKLHFGAEIIYDRRPSGISLRIF